MLCQIMQTSHILRMDMLTAPPSLVPAQLPGLSPCCQEQAAGEQSWCAHNRLGPAGATR